MNALTVTFFPDQRAASRREVQVTLAALAERIEKTTRPQKAKLPWLKCARFGELRTKDKSLRHNANVLGVTGIEGDYDGEQVSFDEAEEALTKAGVQAILYTSPSHDDDRPRWRVLCPLSQEYPPAERDRFLARLNGLFGGIFSRESWTLSQAYYYGAINGNPSHRVAVLDGMVIDLADELDANAIGRPEKPKPNGNGQNGPATPPEAITEQRQRELVDALLARLSAAPDGGKHHALIDISRTLGGYLHLTGWTQERAVEELIRALPASVEDWDKARATAAWAVGQGVKQPLNLEDRPDPRGNGRGSGVGPSPGPVPEPGPEPEPGPQPSPGPEPEPTPKPKRKARVTNVLALVTHINASPAWNGALRFNMLTENYEVCPPIPPQVGAKGPPRPLNDPHDILLATMYFQTSGFPRAGKGVVWDAITAVAHEHSYHPVRDYLTALRWDGVDRVGSLFQRYFKAELPDDPTERDRQVAYLEHISIGTLVGAVARVIKPGCQHDHVPVIVGRHQGMLKSSAVRMLCPDPAWFTDNISPDLIDRDTKESLRGKWIIELAEIPHIRRETERVKAFFSTLNDRYRAAYGKANQDHPRQCVFIGTSNDLEFVDVTGNRRFWPFVAAGMIDIAGIETDRDQLWGEALALYRQGVRWWLPPTIEAIAAERQAAFVEDDVWDGLIARWLDDHPDPFTLADLFAKDTGITPYRDTAAVTKRDEMRAARCLVKLKLVKRRQMIDGRRAVWWLRK